MAPKPQTQPVHKDMAFYCHKDPFGSGLWECIGAGHSHICGRGETEFEAMVEFMAVRDAAINKRPDRQPEDTDEFRQVVGVLHVE